MGVPKFLAEMVMLWDAYFPEGMPSFLGKLEWGCQNSGEMAQCNIFRDSIFPVTPGCPLPCTYCYKKKHHGGGHHNVSPVFEALKNMLVSAKVLCHYDPDKELVLACDAFFYRARSGSFASL